MIRNTPDYSFDENCLRYHRVERLSLALRSEVATVHTKDVMHRVLIIDDSSATRAYVRAALEEMADMQVTEAASGFDALRILPRERFDLLLVDINMPNINGLELISFIRRSETHRDTPLLIISTEASERDRARALSLGANGYLAKPFTAEALEAAVKSVQKQAV